jgi:hypothetical protein
VRYGFSTLLILLLAFSGQAQQKVLSAEKINLLVPEKIKGYYPDGESKSSKITLGTISYSLCERSFRTRDKSVKILLFDYADAAIMYNQAIRKWGEMHPVESDSVVFRAIGPPYDKGWESHSKVTNNAQIVLGINNRFFLTVAGENMELYELRQILMNFAFERFPN